MTTFNPGDRVRVTFEGIYEESGVFNDGDHRIRDLGDAFGKTSRIPPYGTVELIERADDPRKDPVGTVRKSPGGTVVIQNGDGDSSPWQLLVSGTDYPDYQYFTHGVVVGWKKLAPVEGTPAAESHT